jgi:ferredoxin-type protein NapF
MIPLILLEPFSIWGRMTTDILHPLAVSANRLLFYALRPFGIFITLISYNFNLPVFSVTFLTVSLIVFFTIKKGRIYCSLVCPAGTLLSLLSCYSVNRVVIDPSLCTSCGLCGKKCRTGCIDSSGRTVDNSRCVMCGDCLTGCPAGAIGLVKSKAVKYTAQTISRKGRGSFDKSRRSFLSRIKLYSGASLSALLIPSWLTMRKRTLTPTGEKNTPSTPPGSKGVSHFTARCISCHRCVSVCPTNVLQPSLFEYGIKGMLQPVMDYRSGYCEFECTACTRACPSGAIIPITIERKKTIQIGRVYFEKDKCIVVTNGTICGACAEGCPTHAVGMEPYKNNLDIPVTDNSICIGCGSCENICPVPEKAIYVKGLEIHGTAEVREPLYKAPKESANEGFPF